jgi:hypothetical protein
MSERSELHVTVNFPPRRGGTFIGAARVASGRIIDDDRMVHQ